MKYPKCSATTKRPEDCDVTLTSFKKMTHTNPAKLLRWCHLTFRIEPMGEVVCEQGNKLKLWMLVSHIEGRLFFSPSLKDKYQLGKPLVTSKKERRRNDERHQQK